MKVLIIIPARGGSKGIPSKNLAQVAGATLVGHAVTAAWEFLALAPEVDGRVHVDTDDAEIAAETVSWGVPMPFLRPAELGGDGIPTSASTLWVLDRLEQEGERFDAVILLQPTSPLRTAEDILACWRRFDPAVTPSVVAITPTLHPLPIAVLAGPKDVLTWAADAPEGSLRRQDLTASFWVSGLAYVITPALLREDRRFFVPGRSVGVYRERSVSVDIDTPDDLATADALGRMRTDRPITVAGRRIGAGAPCFVIAEAGVNHDGDPALAHQLVEIAADAGADAVKFQTFKADSLASETADQAAYQVTNTGRRETQREMLRRLELPPSVFRELASHARERGILFLSTPFDPESADFLVHELGVPALKLPSGELTHHRFIEHCAGLGVPLLMSTGMATLAEVAAALGVVRRAGATPVGLFHCVTNYPAAPEEANLRAMDTMRQVFRVPVGWSDHTLGVTVSLSAAARGASLLEKHFTVDRSLSGPDHAASLTPTELTELVRGVRAVQQSLGDGLKAPRPSEYALTTAARRSLHLARALKAGTLLGDADVVAVRPGDGLSPAFWSQIRGRRLLRDLPAGSKLRIEDIET